MDTKIKVIVGVLIFLIILISIAIFQSGRSPTIPPDEKVEQPPLTEDPGYSGPEPGSVYQTYTEESREESDKAEKIGGLIKKLPHKTDNFILDYYISVNSFIVVYKLGNEVQGEAEFNSYLKENGIDNKDWLYNLIEKAE